jgi:hypothetical protein
MRVGIGVVCLLALFRCATCHAGAAEDPEALIRQGIDLRKKGDDLRARGYLKRAYELAQTPRSAAQLGLVELALEEFEGSNQHLTEALVSDDPWVRSQKSVLEESRRKARAHLAVLSFLNAAVGTRVKIGEHSFIDVPPDGRLWVSPATTTVTVEERGQKPTVTELHVEAGQTKTIAREVAPPPPGPPTVVPPPSDLPTEPVVARPSSDDAASKVDRPGRALEIAGIAAGGAGVVGFVAGIVCYHVATTKLDALRGADAGHPYHDGDLDWQTYDRAGAGLMIGGAVLTAAGAGAFLWGAHANRAREGRVDSLAISASPGRLVLSGAF